MKPTFLARILSTPPAMALFAALLTLGYGLCMPIAANAQESQQVDDKAIVTLKPGQPVQVQFKDGRKAILKLFMDDTNPLTSTLEVTDNTCTPKIGAICKYHFRYRQLRVYPMWVAHPDPAKIGQVVMRKSDNGSARPAIDNISATAGTDGTMFPDLSAGLPRHELQCTDFSWLPTETAEAPSQMQVIRWENELNFENEDTGLSENRTVGGATDVQLKRLSPNKMRLDSLAYLTGPAGFAAITLAFGTNISMVFQKSSGEPCQVGLASGGIAELQAAVGELDGRSALFEKGRTVTFEDLRSFEDPDSPLASISTDIKSLEYLSGKEVE